MTRTLTCFSVSHFWLQWDGAHAGECPVAESAIYINSAFNIFFDFVVFFLPIPKLLSLQVKDTRRKAGVIATFLVGLFATACSIVRLRYLAAFGQVTNATYHYNDIALWSGLESDFGVICACMPTIAGPIVYFLREKVGSRLSSAASKSSTAAYVKKSFSSGSSRSADDKVAGGRLPSAASERGFELETPLPKHGGIEKTTAMYNQSYHAPSSEDLDTIHQEGDRRMKSQWEV
jgi:hypothetical protein